MKDPAVLFYTNDFLAGTITMSDEQVGKYIRLLCIQHQKGVLTPKDMLNICKTYDEDVYCKFAKDSDGNFYNDRMKSESERRKKYSESRKANRDSKPEKPINKKKSKGKIISESYDKHMETEIVNETVNENNTAIILPFPSEKFEEVWEIWKKFKKEQHKFTYKSQISEQAALKQLDVLSKHSEENALKIIEQSIANGWQGFFELKNLPPKQLGMTPYDYAMM